MVLHKGQRGRGTQGWWEPWVLSGESRRCHGGGRQGCRKWGEVVSYICKSTSKGPASQHPTVGSVGLRRGVTITQGLGSRQAALMW